MKQIFSFDKNANSFEIENIAFEIINKKDFDNAMGSNYFQLDIDENPKTKRGLYVI